jgi:DNA-binding NtrC family response regulator
MGGQNKILLAENERIISLDLKHILEGSNYHVLDIPFNSSLIISYIVKQKPDLLITGVKGNFNFTPLIIRITEEFKLPVLVVTGVPENQLIELKNVKLCSFLMKPYNSEQLIKAVDESLLGSLKE